MAMLGAECSPCCGGWYCCPPVMKATVTFNLSDVETVVSTGGVFPGGSGYSLARINASAMSSLSGTVYQLNSTNPGQGCNTYYFGSDTVDTSENPWLKVMTINTESASVGIIAVLPKRYTELSKTYSAFNCSSTPGGFGGGSLSRQYETGWTYGNYGFASGTYGYITPVRKQSSFENGIFLSNSFVTGSAATTSSGPSSYSWTLTYSVVDPASCSNPFGAPGNSQIAFTSTIPIGTVSISAEFGCP
jgi:hypothetical protein